MRMSYLVCYDIADDKRLKKVFKAMRSLDTCRRRVRFITLRLFEIFGHSLRRGAAGGMPG